MRQQKFVLCAQIFLFCTPKNSICAAKIAYELQIQQLFILSQVLAHFLNFQHTFLVVCFCHETSLKPVLLSNIQIELNLTKVNFNGRNKTKDGRVGFILLMKFHYILKNIICCTSCCDSNYLCQTHMCDKKASIFFSTKAFSVLRVLLAVPGKISQHYGST